MKPKKKDLDDMALEDLILASKRKARETRILSTISLLLSIVALLIRIIILVK